MSNSQFLSVTICCLLVGAVFSTDALAATDESDYLYGEGVHAFFDHNYEGAVTVLLKAEELKSDDPRPYYFLGLVYLHQNKTDQADQYFKKAAQMEYGGRSLRDYAVSEALRRIQGEERLRIEKIRAEERISARANEQRLQEMRYGNETAVARTRLLQTTSQTQNTDAAAPQRKIDVAAENPFGVKPIDPLNTTEDVITTRTTPANPFGMIDANAGEEPVIFVPTTQVSRTPAVVRPERTFVNPDVQGPVQKTITDEQESAQGIDINIIRNMQTEAAKQVKQVGRTWGALFSKKTKEE